MSITAALVAGAASGAAGGLMSKKGKTEVTPKFAEEQKPLLATAQLSALPMAQLMAGQVPAYLRRFMQQQRGMGERMARSRVQDYYRQIGMRGGGDFGPAAMGGVRDIYAGISPAVMQAVGQAQQAATTQAFRQAGQWGMISPTGSTTQEKGGPGMAEHIGAGALQGFSRGMGGTGKPPVATSMGRAAVPNQSLPPAQQGPVRPQVAGQEALQRTQWLNKQTAGMSPFGGAGLMY